MTLTSQPISVVHLITLLELGGAQGNTIYTVRHLNSDKFKTYLWSGRGAFWDRDVESDLQGSGRLRFLRGLVRPIHPLCDVLSFFELWYLLRKEKPTILHTHSSKAGIIGRLAGYCARVPIIIHTFHGFGFNDQQKPWTKFLYVALEKITAPLTDALIFVSRSNQLIASQLGIGKQSQYVLIRSGVPLKTIASRADAVDKKAFKEQLGIKSTDNVITTIGAFKPQKNLADFISFASQIHQMKPDLTFLIIGDGEQRSKLEALVKEYFLEKKVKFLGWRQDIPELLAITDIFVMTSLWEGLPRALVEAMSLGIPSVCYETDGVVDILENDSEALIPQGDIRKMTAAVDELLSDHELFAAVSHHSKEKIGTEFDIDVMVQQQEKLYTSFLA